MKIFTVLSKSKFPLRVYWGRPCRKVPAHIEHKRFGRETRAVTLRRADLRVCVRCRQDYQHQYFINNRDAARVRSRNSYRRTHGLPLDAPVRGHKKRALSS